MTHTEHPCPFEEVTAEPGHVFFGYYDKCPWDHGQRYMLAMRTHTPQRPLVGDEVAELGMIDLSTQRFHVFDQTRAWCWQQGTMLQWVGNHPDQRVIYNRLDDERFVSVIRDVHTSYSRVLERPIYCVSRDGTQALSLNFARLAVTRPGYGYPALADPKIHLNHPDDDGIWHIDLTTGTSRLILSLDQLVRFHPIPELVNTQHWVNHLCFNPSGTRFSLLHRWRTLSGGSQTRLFTANVDGSELYLLNEMPMTSHFDWVDDTRFVAWATRPTDGTRYYVMHDQTQHADVWGRDVFTTDGHCTISPDGQWMLTDTYPDKQSNRTLILYNIATQHRIDIGKFYSPPQINGEFRCDLHPRFSRDGRQVCIDSAHTDERRMYIVDVSEVVNR